MARNGARYIWNDPHGEGRNRYVLLRHGFELPGRPAGGRLNIFADTRYRLIVNGQVLGHGPARFFPAKPEYDTYELAGLLRQGANVIAVVVNSYGCVSFHSETSVGGLIAWGEAADVDGHRVALATDEAWRAIESPGHRRDTAYLSFALNPGEQLDARSMPDGWDLPDFDASAWPNAVACARPEHWGPLQPRSIPLLDEGCAVPRQALGAFAARPPADEDVHSLMALAPGGEGHRTRGRVAVLTFLHSPRPQRVTFGAWWGRYWLNGLELTPTPRGDVALRQDFTADLREGPNSLLVYESLHSDCWPFYLALPKAAGLTIGAEGRGNSPNAFLVGGPWVGRLAEAADAMALPLAEPADLPEALGPWRPWPRDQAAGDPCRERAWKTFQRISDAQSFHPDVSALAAGAEGAALSLVLDFGTEVLGRPVVDFTAAAGTLVDLTYSERLRDDGVPDLHERFFVDMAERYIARAGRQTWQTFHPRGFRYLELLITGDLRAFDLHGVSLTRANYPVENVGSFECSDGVLNDVWKLGRATLHACMEDAYLDCPCRERGLYSGDFLVQFFGNLAAYGDTRLFRRCIELFLLAQGDNGLVPGGAYGLPPGRHGDYSAILVQAMWHYWARTGDTGFLREMQPRVRRLLDGLEALGSEGEELFDGSDMSAYIDLSHMDRGGFNCALNCFFQRAFADGARVLELLGEARAAAHLADRAASLAAAIRREFWDERLGAFVDRRKADVPETEPSVAANALALLYDVADAAQAPRATAWLVEAMRNNRRVEEPTENDEFNVTSYFSFYALGALYKQGRIVEAEQFIRTQWGRMLDEGAWTCWEYFADNASRCHAWSSSPTHYLSTEVLGVRLPEPGDLSRVEIRPRPGSLRWAHGVYPHPAGPILVSWAIEADRLDLNWDAPDGVEVTTPAD